MFLSIIIPVYNSTQYLSECVNSLLNQSFNDFEILLVDDQSTDNSPDICRNLPTVMQELNLSSGHKTAELLLLETQDLGRQRENTLHSPTTMTIGDLLMLYLTSISSLAITTNPTL